MKTTKLCVIGGDTVAQQASALSPARQKLRDLHDQVAAHQRQVTEHRAAAFA